MFLRILLLLILVPIAELWLILEVDHLIASQWGMRAGLVVTFGMILFTGVLGASLARRQGLRTMRAIQESLARGELPTESLLDGAMVLVGGALLLTPGFITDAVGFSLLLPWTQKLYRRAIVAWMRKKINMGDVSVRRWSEAGRPDGFAQETIDGQPVIDVTPKEQP